MKELLTLQGGYPREMDYLLNLQAELYTVNNSVFSALGVDMILSGCAVHDNGNGTVNIAAGIVYVAGEALRFDAANNIIADGTKAMTKGAYTSSDQKTFADGSQKNVYREAKAIIANAANTAAEIKIKTTLYNLKQYIQDAMQSYEVKGTVKDIYDFDGTFLDNFDGSGLGITARWLGWALDNANNGTRGSAGKALLAAGTYTNPVNGEETEFNEGDTGGELKHKLTQAEIAKFTLNRTRTDNIGPLYETNSMQAGHDRGLHQGDAYDIGGDQPHNNMQPYNVVYRVVKIV